MSPRGSAECRSRAPLGYAPWILCLTLGIAFAAAAFAKMRPGPDWIATGAVRYHFMAEALTAAFVPWGPWIAARLWLSVVLSAVVVLVEGTLIVAAFSRPPVRLAYAFAAAALFVGFALFHGAVWPAWWVLVLGLLPWEWVDGWMRTREGPRHEASPHESPPPSKKLLPAPALVAALLLLAQQVVVSRDEREVPPFFSAYDMYSTTFASPEVFEQANGGPRFSVLADGKGGIVDVGDCVRRDARAISEMSAALDDDAKRAEGLPLARPTVVGCAAIVAGASRVQVRADQRAFDWVGGRTWYRYRDRLLVEWPLDGGDVARPAVTRVAP